MAMTYVTQIFELEFSSVNHVVSFLLVVKLNANPFCFVDMDAIAEKTEFDSWILFLEAKKAYEEASKTLLTTRGSIAIKGDDEKAQNFRYMQKMYVCKAGPQRESQSKGHRTSATYRMNCPVTASV